ncbi:reticulocyte-binding protein 2-like isoform X2 [Maniola hyperantus]|nr:uncharacterized protein LOC117985949 isoform X2 [Maniola hyperantus]XP_034828638.1 uncharacterized protein LOC117985949 isoform X2 [Maniola hyperantus]XP_034828639.1 uncharacterized protein LOC117985949 isoform X2 [Maniola hyperantus]
MWSTALDVLLTTLRYIAPATLLTLFWGQQSFLFKLLKYIDSAVRPLIFSSEEQKQTVLQWLGEAGPVRVDKLEVVWRHGWILCGVLDAALPGACAGHPPTRLSIKHAQSIADNYLGVEPVFSRQELESNDSLSRHQEWKFIHYLESVRLALSKLTPPTPKSTNSPTPQTTADEEVTQFTLDYIARGSGLVAAQINHKIYFKIYPTAQQSLDPSEINILIHGPKNTYGIAVLPPILGKAQMIRQNLLGLQSKICYTEKVLPITQGTTYLRSYGIHDMNKTFYIPKTKYDIDIDIELKHDHARVGYIASLEGKYEISITSKGQNVVGSPFNVIVSNNIVENLERDNFCLEDGEEVDIVDVKTDRKVVLRIVDFVTEKMLLNENGTFEKISDEEARYLMQTEKVNVLSKHVENSRLKNNEVKSKSISNKFYQTAKTVLTLCRICRIFKNCHDKNLKRNDKDHKDLRQKQGIPDILNSTFDDSQLKSHNLLKNTNRIIVPENISVSLLTERPKTLVKEKKLIDTSDMDMHDHIDSLENYNILKVDPFEDDTMSIDTVQSNNPFVNDIYDESYTVKKGLRALVPKVFETHNSQNEETENLTTELYIDRQFETSNQNINPFNDTTELERPKTPVYKIISGELTNRNDSVYINSEQAFLTDESTCSSFTNPFLKHETETTDLYREKPDFIIGAPVSLPPVNFVPSGKTNIEIMPSEKKNKTNKEKEITGSHFEKDFSTKDSSVSSLDSNLTQDIIIIPRTSPTPTTITQSQSSRETSPRKDTWDSAYVSIDDSNCLSENETFNKRKSPLSEELSRMGPAEREIWHNDSELKDIAYIDEDHRSYKHDLKRPEFTPIIEENERNITSDTKDGTYGNNTDIDSVAATFSELNDIYDDLYTNSENVSVTTTQDDKLQNLGIDYTLQGNDIRVNSASALLADVKRHAKKFEGEISEVQVNATESFSVSPSLHAKGNADYQEQNNNDEIQFCDRILHSNIVLEKKKYWDDRIRQIEAKSEEIRLFQNKRRLTSKHLRRNDSISKRKGKKIVQHLLKSGHDDYEIYTKSNTENTDFIKTQAYVENVKPANSSEENTTAPNNYDLITCFGTKPAKNKKQSTIESLNEVKETISKFANVDITDKGSKQVSNSSVELKQELSEKVFQAFETSPKRFFGTSRKHILNKIDTFSGTPDVQKQSGKDVSCVNHESGLVSSRISMFHNISQTEELPYPQRKSTSMHNVSHQSSERNITLDRLNRDSKEEVQEDKKVSNEIFLDCANNLKLNKNNQVQSSYSPLKEKRARLIQSANNKSFDETLCPKRNNIDSENNYVKRTIKGYDKQSNSQFQSSTSKLKSISKSEMDIFNKTTVTIPDQDLDKHKSYEELPKVSVKKFISLYEDVSKTSNNKPSPIKNIHSIKPTESSNNQVPISTEGTTKVNANEAPVQQPSSSSSSSTAQLGNTDTSTLGKTKITEEGMVISTNQNIYSSLNFKDKEGKYLSLSDIDIEIIDNDRERKESSPKGETAHLDYKNRFSKAKQFFQSLEELRDERRLKKFGLNSFENSSSIESLDDNRRRKRNNIKKSNSMPSSEIAKAWNQLQEQKEESKKLVKISEKFNVDDLFEDVMDGRLSRQGSLRGIPHKKAVLETFRSMENVSDCKLNSYEMAESQLNDFAKDKMKNAQSYLNEYPYLPTTDPSKYHSRLDVNAPGLITFKELRKIPRRNSVPNVRLNPTFTADL